MTRKTPKRPRDPNQLAKRIIDLATGEVEEVDPDEGKNPHAIALGKKGGKKGAKARWADLTPEQRSEAASLAAQARWRKKST